MKLGWGLLGVVCAFWGMSALAETGKPTLADAINPAFYIKRSQPVFSIGVVYYGNERTEADMIRLQALLEKRFLIATSGLIRLTTVFTAVIPYKYQIKDYPDYKLPNITDPARLQRLWYYDHIGAKIVQEVYEQTKLSLAGPQLAGVDAVAVATGAQFDGMGFAYGRVAVTESPREIAWGLPDGGYTDETSDGQVVDELIHELGHTLYLDHAASQCFQTGMTYKQSLECCANSPNKDDVMSYCRQRKMVDDADTFFGFKECNLRILKNQVIPAMLNGGAWSLKNRERCI